MNKVYIIQFIILNSISIILSTTPIYSKSSLILINSNVLYSVEKSFQINKLCFFRCLYIT